MLKLKLFRLADTDTVLQSPCRRALIVSPNIYLHFGSAGRDFLSALHLLCFTVFGSLVESGYHEIQV